MNPFERRLILILSPCALGFGTWLGLQLDPGEGTIRLLLVWIAVCVVAVAGMVVKEKAVIRNDPLVRYDAFILRGIN